MPEDKTDGPFRINNIDHNENEKQLTRLKDSFKDNKIFWGYIKDSSPGKLVLCPFKLI